MSPTREEFYQQGSINSSICQVGLWWNYCFGLFLFPNLGQVDVRVYDISLGKAHIKT